MFSSTLASLTARIVLLLVGFFVLVVPAKAELTFVKESVIADSEDDPVDPFAHRIYYYDMAIDKSGRAHVLYALPQSNRVHSSIMYAREDGDSWVQTTLSSSGKYTPTGIQIQIDDSETLHLTYVVGSNDYDSSLVYRTIDASGAVGSEKTVSSGGWRSCMQLDPSNGAPLIVREWTSGFHLYRLSGTTFREQSITLPVTSFVRLGDFHVDSNGGGHLLFGDYAWGNGIHNLWYASSDTVEAGTWQGEMIDNSGRIYELEFWVDLTTDLDNNPIAAAFSYNTTEMSTVSTWGVFYQRSGGAWKSVVATRNQPEARAGMGPGLTVDQYGFHGVWDNSPPHPYEFESDNGGIYYRFSPDGENWKVSQLLAPYSAEGRCVTIRHNDELNVLVLGDYQDTKLRLLRYQMPGDTLFELAPDHMLYYSGESITFNLFLRGSQPADLYAVCFGRNGQGLYQFGADLQWHAVSSGRVEDLVPLVTNFTLFDYNGELMTIPVTALPASVTDIFDYYSVLVKPGGNLLSPDDWLSPLFHRYIYSNWPRP